MPANRNALIRYKTIDKCLQNRYRKWTLEDLIDACSDALYEYEGIDKGVSKRTIQGDIQIMRSDKLGYNAPIIVVDRRYYTYEDRDYSITNIPLSEQDLNKLMESVEFLKQFKGFSHFEELSTMVQKLEDHIYSQKTNRRPIIDFEKNENLKGLQFLDKIYQYILKKESILITYKSFKARKPGTFVFHPFLLKEYRNRWFVLGVKNEKRTIMNLALDRIIKVSKSNKPLIIVPNFDSLSYYRHIIGATVSPTLTPEKVILFIPHRHAPYVLTKPFHHSQKLINRDNYGITISLMVQHNFELEKEILAFGDGIKVIKPLRLKNIILERLTEAVDSYNSEISTDALSTLKKKLNKKGSYLLNKIYTSREINKIKFKIRIHHKINKNSSRYINNIFKEIPEIKEIIYNKNLVDILNIIDSEIKLSNAAYFSGTHSSGENYEWQQKSNSSSLIIRIHLDITNTENGVMQIIPGSQGKIFTTKEIETITQNSIPRLCKVSSGGIHFYNPMILHSILSPSTGKKRRLIQLEYKKQ